VIVQLAYPQTILSTQLKDWHVTIEAPVDYHMAVSLPVTNERISGDEKKKITEYAGKDSSLSVLGGLEYANLYGLDVYYSPSHRKALDMLAKDISDRISFYTSYLGEPKWVGGVSPLPILLEYPSTYLWLHTTNLHGAPFLNMYETNIPNMYKAKGPFDYPRNSFDQLVLELWFGQQSIYIDTCTELEVGLNQYLTVLYRKGLLGQEYYDQIMQAVTEFLDKKEGQSGRPVFLRDLSQWTNEQSKVFMVLDKIYRSLGEDAFKHVAKAVNAHYLEHAQKVLAQDPSVNPYIGMEYGESGEKIYKDPEIRKRNEYNSQKALLDALASISGSDEVYSKAVKIFWGTEVNEP
jgi:hypothetical protein